MRRVESWEGWRWATALAVVLIGLAVVPAARGAVSPERWMADEARWIHARPLNGIIIPGSHDAATYGLQGQPLDFHYAGTQDIDLTTALNDGIRFFDLRVKYKDWGGQAGADYWAYHGNSVSETLRFGQMLDQIARWAVAPGHQRELIMLNLSINNDNGKGPFPTKDCENFRKALGSQLLQPSELEQLGVSDPYQATFGQLWSLPGHPHVMTDDARCTGGQWPAADAAQGVQGAFGSYYANQCDADQYAAFPGVINQVLGALSQRAKISTEGSFGGDANEYVRDSPLASGFYVSYLQSTTTLWCIAQSLKDYTLPVTRAALAAFYREFLADSGNARRYGNIIAGDFVEQTDLVADAIAMNKLWPLVPDKLTVFGGDTQQGVVGQPLALPLQVLATDQGEPVPQARASFAVQQGAALFNNSTLAVGATANDNGVVRSPPLYGGPTSGPVAVQAMAPGVLDPVSFTAQFRSASDLDLTVTGGTPLTGEVDRPLSGITVRLTNGVKQPVAGRQVIFTPQPSKVVGSYPTGSWITTTDQNGVAQAPPLTAGDQAGRGSVQIEGVGYPNSAFTSVPVTIRPAAATALTPKLVAPESAQIQSLAPEQLRALVTDRYGNPVAHAAVTLTVNGGGTWATKPDGASAQANAYLVRFGRQGRRIRVRSNHDGVITAPGLIAGRRLGVEAVSATLAGRGRVLARLAVIPGAAATITDTGGDRQRTVPGRAFAAPLTATVRDRDGDRVYAGVPVTFTLTGVDAEFPTSRHREALRAVLGRVDAARAQTHRHRLTVPTDSYGIATAPAPTPRDDGQVTVTAAIDGARTVGRWILNSRRPAAHK